MKLFCNHKWEVLSETTTESMNEQNVRLFGKSPTPNTVYVSEKMSAKKHILVVKCDKCGKLKRFVDNI